MERRAEDTVQATRKGNSIGPLKWCWAFALAGMVTAGEGSSIRFGFTGPEIFPVDNQIGHLRAVDLDGDGLQDLVVVNNARSKINLLYNQTGQTNRPSSSRLTVKREINQLPPDARFRIDSIASEKRIASMVAADLNSDGRPDLAYYGEPKELVVHYNEGTNGWTAPKRWPIEDGALHANGLAYGDLNGDRRTDVVLLAETHIYLLAQQADQKLGEPVKIPFTGPLPVKALQILDLDGNGRDDLLMVNWDSPNPLRFRLQDESGQLGPEIHFALPAIRSYLADDLDKDGKTEIVTIAQQSGRAQVSSFKLKPAEPLAGTLKQGQFEVLPLQRTSKSRRGMAWADLNGDRMPDLLVAEPDSGDLTVYVQQSEGKLGAPKKFPTLTGISDLAVADWDQDGRAEIFLLSPEERQVGISQFSPNGRVPFPNLMPITGRPLALAVGALKSEAKPMLMLIVDQDGRRELQLHDPSGELKTHKLSESFRSNPSELTMHDLNQDGLMDLVILIPYEKMKILLQLADGGFEEQDLAPPAGSMEQPWLSRADVDGDGKPELLLAQKSFVRAVVLQVEKNKQEDSKAVWTLKVKEQINAISSNSRIVGAAALVNGAREANSLFMLDAERKALTLCQRDESGVWNVVRNILLPVTEFNALQPVAMGGAEANSIAFLGLNAVAWIPFEGQSWEFTELDGYETPIKDGFLNDVVSGDLNQDDRKDLVFLETAKNYLDLVIFEKPHRLSPADRWQVFEERTFRSRRNEFPEPREALIADLTGDGKNDLAVVVHDRILVYPQE